MSLKKIPAEQEKQLREQYKYQLATIAPTLPFLSAYTFIGLQDIMESKDVNKYTGAGKTLAKKYGAGAVGGLLCSMVLTRLNIKNFLKRPYYVRLPIRLIAFMLPIGAATIAAAPDLEAISNIEKKYNSRIQKFKVTRNFNHIDPDGIMFQEFIEKSSKY